jgi:hypothetical protein
MSVEAHRYFRRTGSDSLNKEGEQVSTKTSRDPRRYFVPDAVAGSGVQPTNTDVLLADVTAHLLCAYAAMDKYSRYSTTPWSSPAFESACRLLCGTLVAIDEFSESIWADVSSAARSCREPTAAIISQHKEE